MRSNIKSQALISLNPTFNIDFLNDQIYYPALLGKHRRQEGKNNIIYISDQDDQDKYQTSVQTQTRVPRGLSQMDQRSIGKLRGKSLSYRKLQNPTPIKKMRKIDYVAKKLGTEHTPVFRIKKYGKWIN